MRLGPGDVAVQLSGDGTVTAIVERSTRVPTAANWAPADSEVLTGSLDTGIEAVLFREPARAWWRVRVTARTGTVKVSINGRAA